MGTHLIPRSNVKGQDRFFIWFSAQGLVGTLIGAALGAIPHILISPFSQLVAVSVWGLFAFAGFIVGQGKVPDNNGNQLFKKLGGLYVRDCIITYFKFKKNKKKFLLRVSEDDVFAERKTNAIEKIALSNGTNETE